MKRVLVFLSIVSIGLLVACDRTRDRNYGPGVSDTEIVLGNTMPYSGPASALGSIGRTIDAYFRKLNESGGINGRKIRFVTVDDGYSPPKTVEQVRKLIEQEEVAAIVSALGTPTNAAVRDYHNGKKVPQLFLISAASMWNNPKEYPWSMSLTWGPNYFSEGFIEARYALERNPAAKIAVLYQNDDAGKDVFNGLKAGLGDHLETALVAEASYEVTDPTVDSQIISLHGSGADTFFIYAITPRACSQAIRKAYNIGWRPVRFLFSGCAAKEIVLKPAGLEASTGILTLAALKMIDESSTDDPEVQEYLAFMEKYYPEGKVGEVFNIYGYMAAHAVAEVLRRAGDDLTRENIMRQAAGLKDLRLPMLRDGVTINTSAEDYATIEDGYLLEFDGKGLREVSKLLHGN